MLDNKSYIAPGSIASHPCPRSSLSCRTSLPPWLMEPGSLQSVLAISHLPSSDISFIFQLLKAQLSACFQMSSSKLSHVSLFHDRRILKPRPTFFPCCRKQKARRQLGGDRNECLRALRLHHPARGDFCLAASQPRCQAGTPWCGSIWTSCSASTAHSAVWTNIVVCYCDLLCCLWVLEPKYFYRMGPGWQW